MFLAPAAAFAMFMVVAFPADAQTAEAGRLLYSSLGCTGCHNTPISGGAGLNNRPGANNPQAIRNAVSVGGIVGMIGLVVTDTEASSLALFLGQKEAPSFTVVNGNTSLMLRLRAGVSADKNIHPLLTRGTAGAASDGTITLPARLPTVGFTALAPANAATSGASSTASIIAGAFTTLSRDLMNYRARYVSGGSVYTGSDNFTVSVANESATVATRIIAVTVFGITSGATASVRVQDTGPATPVYTIISNDPLATFGVTVDRAAAPTLSGVSLASLGLSLGTNTCTAGGCSQPIVGTFTGFAAAYTLNVTAAISGSTAVESGGGNVTKAVALTMAGITSANPAAFNQNVSIPTYTVTASPTPLTSNQFSMSSQPTGLSFSALNGQLTGIPTVSGSYTGITFGATTAAGAVTQGGFTVTVNSAGPPAISSNIPASTTAAGTVGTLINGSNYFVTLTNPSLTGMVFGATGLPTNLTVNVSGQFIGTPTQSGDFPISITGSNSFGAGAAVNRTIRINPNALPVISGAPSVAVSANQFGTAYTIVATNPPILSYAVVAGTLPTGLTLNPDGTVTGTPTVSGGPTNVTFRATNVVPGNSNDLVVPFTITPSSLPVVTAPFVAAPALTGTVNTAISPTIQISATNPPILAYGATGLPAGLTVSGSGLISGSPSQSGDFDVVATASNAVPGLGTSAPAVKIRIAPNAAPSINSAASVSSSVNVPSFNYPITASNPVFSGFAVASGVLPSGLSLVVTPTGVAGSSTAAITGTPNVSGAFPVTLTATNSFGTSAPFPLAITIVPTTGPVVTASFPAIAGTVQTVFTPIQINATNPPITGYAATGLPGGLSVNASGQIVGTPTQSGTFAVTLSATNVANTGFSSQLSLVINPNVVPTISSANTATGAANSVFAGYQITATNTPLTSYAIAAPGALPAGLVLDTATGAISGTPTASGSFSTLLRASNVVGASAPFTLAFTIVPSTAPVITSPTFASFPAGSPIAPLQVVATNPAILSYSATGLPPGLQINAATGVIDGTPTTPGNYSAMINAINAVGPGAGRTVPFTIGVPAPQACAMSVPVNTPTTLNLATCLFNGFNPTGVTVLATPAHGAAVASGTNVTYTPGKNYFGPDSFTFVGTGLGGQSPQGTVTVTVTGRPDPIQDPTVTAIVSAQIETAQRFSRAQISNFQRRMESLHRPPGATGAGGGALQGQLPSLPNPPAAGSAFAGAVTAATAPVGSTSSIFSAGTSASPLATPPSAAQNASAIGAALALPRTIGSDIVNPGGSAVLATLLPRAVEIREAEALNALASGTGLRSIPFSESVISLIKSRSLDLASIGTAAGLNTTPDKSGKTNYWIEGMASFGTRDAAAGLASAEFSSNGISIGMDQRLNDDLAWGVGLGYGRDKATIGTDGSVNRSRGYSLAVYGSYQIRPNTYLDGLLGVGTLDFDSRRFVQPANAFALGSRSGTQLFGSLTGGYEIREGNSLVSPYGRLDFATNRLATSSETGAGAFALTYFSQTSTSVQGALGVRAESAHATSFGFAIPRVRAEARHEFKGNETAFIGYADQPGGPRFGIPATGGSRNSLVLGLGSEFLFRDGLTLSLEYQLTHSFSNDSGYALRLRLSKDFDAKGLPKLKLAELSQDDSELDYQFDAGYTYDDNVTRAKAGPDRRNDDFYSFNVGRTFAHRLSDQSRLLFTGTFGGQKFHRFNGLSNLQAGLETEYQFRESSEFNEPTYGAFAKLTGEAFESSLRDGYRFSAGVSVRLPLTDRIGLFGALSHNLRNANSDVFSTRDNSLRANVDYTLSNRETLYVGTELRVGEIVSTGRPSLENATIAKVFAQDDAYVGGQLFSYQVDARTWLTTVGYNLSFGPRDSIDFSWRHVRSTPGIRPPFVTNAKSYKANQLSAVYLLRF
ncbi:MAG: autotransporter domain-containing protein [Rhodoferax sp.]|nr:autotransporter domain-containing protein [Rhodoferax sp.]